MLSGPESAHTGWEETLAHALVYLGVFSDRDHRCGTRIWRYRRRRGRDCKDLFRDFPCLVLSELDSRKTRNGLTLINSN